MESVCTTEYFGYNSLAFPASDSKDRHRIPLTQTISAVELFFAAQVYCGRAFPVSRSDRILTVRIDYPNHATERFSILTRLNFFRTQQREKGLDFFLSGLD